MDPAGDTLARVDPSHEDGFVRGASEFVGGPSGKFADRRPTTRWFRNASAIVLTLAVLVFCLSWLQKSRCADGAWENNEQYTHFCYTDVLALYYAEHLSEGAVPYFQWPVEYPVLTGAFMGAIGLPVHQLGRLDPSLNQGQVFYNLNVVVLSALGVAAVAVVLALRRRRPWDALMFVLAPALIVTATVNWDLLAVSLTMFFLYAWARRWPIVAGMLLGLAAAAKFYPLFIAGALVVLAIRTRRWRATMTTIGFGVATWVAVNAPIFIFARTGWNRFWELSSTRPIDWGTFWYIGFHLPKPGEDTAGLAWFLWLGAHIPTLNAVTYLLFGLGCLGVLALTVTAPRPPRLAQLAFVIVAIFLLTSKVWSQQFVLWLIPLAVLARPRWGALLVWQVAEVLYFLAFYAQMLNMSNRYVIPEGAFVLAASLRWLTVAFLVVLVVRDIRRPGLDVVRHAYDDDPDGGDFGWTFRRGRPMPISTG